MRIIYIIFSHNDYKIIDNNLYIIIVENIFIIEMNYYSYNTHKHLES